MRSGNDGRRNAKTQARKLRYRGLGRRLGCNNFGRRIHDVAGARAVVDRAIDLGITLFDTADAYGNGTSESFLGETIGKRRPQVVIATKFGWGSPSGTSRADHQANHRGESEAAAHRLH